jgi:hypothetical protein
MHHHIRQFETGQRVRVRPILHLPASPTTVYRRRASHTYPAVVVETIHLPNGTAFRVVLDEHETLVMRSEERNMLVPAKALHAWRCECRRCAKRPATRGVDYARARWRRWASAAWAWFESKFDY